MSRAQVRKGQWLQCLPAEHKNIRTSQGIRLRKKVTCSSEEKDPRKVVSIFRDKNSPLNTQNPDSVEK